jgi:AraC-like DNA-binding protein
MLTDLALFFIGFSLLSGIVLIAGHLASRVYTGLLRARIFGLLLVVNLGTVQWFHYISLTQALDLWNSSLYVVQLFITAPLFYFFCRAVLYRQEPEPRWKILSGVPIAIAWCWPSQWMFLVGIVVASAYFAALAYELFKLRSQRKRYFLEMTSLIVLAVVAATTLLLGIFMPLLNYDSFIALYSIIVGICFLPVLFLVVRFPDILSVAEEVANQSYASSTLGKVNVAVKLELINKLMLVDKLYMNEGFSLGQMSEHLALTPHQTSELFNAKLGIGFSRYLRQQRIDESKRQLLEQPHSSILSIALAVGFVSQSAFYTAFKEIEGITPGQYRQQQQNSTETPAIK